MKKRKVFQHIKEKCRVRKIRCGFRHPANFVVTVDGNTGTFNTPDEAEKFLSREVRDWNMNVGSSRVKTQGVGRGAADWMETRTSREGWRSSWRNRGRLIRSCSASSETKLLNEQRHMKGLEETNGSAWNKHLMRAEFPHLT